MAEEQHHHFFHHQKAEETKPTEADLKKEVKHHEHLEHYAELGAAAATAYALVRMSWFRVHIISDHFIVCN